jgi:hypothetical protein
VSRVEEAAEKAMAADDQAACASRSGIRAQPRDLFGDQFGNPVEGSRSRDRSAEPTGGVPAIAGFSDGCGDRLR